MPRKSSPWIINITLTVHSSIKQLESELESMQGSVQRSHGRR